MNKTLKATLWATLLSSKKKNHTLEFGLQDLDELQKQKQAKATMKTKMTAAMMKDLLAAAQGQMQQIGTQTKDLRSDSNVRMLLTYVLLALIKR